MLALSTTLKTKFDQLEDLKAVSEALIWYGSLITCLYKKAKPSGFQNLG